MPSAKILKEKQKIVEELTEKLKSKSGVLVNYSGITVNEDTEMRVKIREAEIDYSVVKNTLMRLAIKNIGFDELDPILNGTTSLAVSNTDPIAPARLIKEYADKFTDYFEIKAGFMDGRVLSAAEVIELAGIPPLPILQAKLLGTMLAPIASLAVVLKAIAEKGGAFVDGDVAVISGEPEHTKAEAEPVAEEATKEPEPTKAEAEPAAEEATKEPEPTKAEAEPTAEEATKEPAPAKAAAKTKAKNTAKEPESAETAEKAPAKTPAKKPAAKKTTAKTPAKEDNGEKPEGE